MRWPLGQPASRLPARAPGLCRGLDTGEGGGAAGAGASAGPPGKGARVSAAAGHPSPVPPVRCGVGWALWAGAPVGPCAAVWPASCRPSPSARRWTCSPRSRCRDFVHARLRGSPHRGPRAPPLPLTSLGSVRGPVPVRAPCAGTRSGLRPASRGAGSVHSPRAVPWTQRFPAAGQVVGND